MKATALLKEQHRKVEKLFSKIEEGDHDLLPELANDLAGHMAIEQEIFYPAVRSIAREEISEAFEEHSVAELALKRAIELDPEEEQFSARVTVLKELIQHHVEEEEGELFPKVEKALSEEDLEELAEEMQARFDEVVALGYEAALPEGFDETSADQALDEADAEEEGEDDDLEASDEDGAGDTADASDDQKDTKPTRAKPARSQKRGAPSHSR